MITEDLQEDLQEVSIVWLEDISKLDYVRVVTTMAGTRGRPVRFECSGRQVGYAVLRADARNTGHRGCFNRRVFWLAKHDRDSEPNGPYKTGSPGEGVDPRTVAPNVHGEHTDRSWGAPIAKARKA